MKKIFKVLGIVLLVLVLGIVCIAAYVKVALPKKEAVPVLKIDNTPALIQRGAYLANYVMVCTDCHSERDWTKYAGPVYADSVGSGSTLFDQKLGLPGSFHSKNITSYHLGNWTDGEIFRAITAGVSKDGKALFPLMPYQNFGKLDKEDIYSVIAYLRSLPAVKKDIAASKADFPMNFIINTMPVSPAFTIKPSESNSVAYGHYLVMAAGCQGCHSPAEKGTPIAGKEFAGGEAFTFPQHIAYSANLTPDVTGLKNLTKDQFIRQFKQYSDSTYKSGNLTMADFNSPMPWTAFTHMQEKDLSAIYDYLRTLKPVKNQVTKFVRKKAA